MNDYSDIDLNNDLDDLETLSFDEIKENLASFKTDKICQIIVCNKYFSFNKDLTVSCMEELASRRSAGDPFNYEEFIDSSFNELPVLNFALPDLRTMLAQVIGKKI